VQINDDLGGHAGFHAEKDGLKRAGLAASDYISVDDSGARHQGRNGYVTQIGNEWFAWFSITDSKSRVNFLELLRAGHQDYILTEAALDYIAAESTFKPVTPRYEPAFCHPSRVAEVLV
jgi:hypothetical protein